LICLIVFLRNKPVKDDFATVSLPAFVRAGHYNASSQTEIEKFTSDIGRVRSTHPPKKIGQFLSIKLGFLPSPRQCKNDALVLFTFGPHLEDDEGVRLVNFLKKITLPLLLVIILSVAAQAQTARTLAELSQPLAQSLFSFASGLHYLANSLDPQSEEVPYELYVKVLDQQKENLEKATEPILSLTRLALQSKAMPDEPGLLRIHEAAAIHQRLLMDIDHLKGLPKADSMKTSELLSELRWLQLRAFSVLARVSVSIYDIKTWFNLGPTDFYQLRLAHKQLVTMSLRPIAEQILDIDEKSIGPKDQMEFLIFRDRFYVNRARKRKADIQSEKQQVRSFLEHILRSHEQSGIGTLVTPSPFCDNLLR